MSMKDNTEIERKFAIEYPTKSELDAMLSLPGAKRVKITQIYLSSSENESRRIRRAETDGNTKYRLTTKRGAGIVREEYESDITEEEFFRLAESNAAEGLSPVKKTRVCVPSGDKVIEIDLYDGFTDYAVAEIELDSPDEELPDMSAVKVIREVTGEKEWLNVSIAENGMPEK